MRIGYVYSKIVNRLRGKAIIDSRIHKTSRINYGCNIVNSTMDRYSYCGNDCHIVCSDIGAFCSISDHVFIGGAEHPLDWVSTSPVFQNTNHSGPAKRFIRLEIPQVKRTIIGNDVWIGHGATIKQGVTIGNGAVIGSNALVTKDVEPYAIVGGCPAKLIKYRFNIELRERLLQSQWWELKDVYLAQFGYLADNPEEFISAVKNCVRTEDKLLD